MATQPEGKFLGYPIFNGPDPYPSMQATAIYGSLHSILSPFTLAAKEADFIADCANWDPTPETIAKTYRTLIPYYVDGPYDVFDILTALYQAFLANQTGIVKAFGFGTRAGTNKPTIRAERAASPVRSCRNAQFLGTATRSSTG